MNVFERYAPFIQDYIYRSGWQSLRGVQNAAGEAIFGTEENVLLTASTASGKTEAAFFPILTLLDENPSKTVGVLYIAPLKALINDQFGRLSELCEEEGIVVTRWHGDAAVSRKQKLLYYRCLIVSLFSFYYIITCYLIHLCSPGRNLPAQCNIFHSRRTTELCDVAR